MDTFKDRLSQHAWDTGRPALTHQCRGRELEPCEMALADALMAIYGVGMQDFDTVANELAARGIKAPRSGRTDWTAELLKDELAITNALLDEAYAEHGYGA